MTSSPRALPGAPVPPGEGLDQFGRMRAWVDVDSGAIAANARALRRSLAATTALMAVVKADGYGHGAVAVARAALEGGATSLGVATLAEAVELRQAGVEAPVLVLGNLSQVEELRHCLRWRLMPTLSSMREALLCQNLASAAGRSMAVQLKLDTGMARLGADWQEGPRLVAAMGDLDAVDLVGIYSHLACADAPPEADDGLTTTQQRRFDAVLSSLAEQGLVGGCRHLANSAATLRCRSLHYDLVRVGLALYGQAPGRAPQRLPGAAAGPAAAGAGDPAAGGGGGGGGELRPSLCDQPPQPHRRGGHRLRRRRAPAALQPAGGAVCRPPAAPGGGDHHGPADAGCHRLP